MGLRQTQIVEYAGSFTVLVTETKFRVIEASRQKRIVLAYDMQWNRVWKIVFVVSENEGKIGPMTSSLHATTGVLAKNREQGRSQLASKYRLPAMI